MQSFNNIISGIDVSHHQGTIDWAAVKGAKCDFAFIKATEGQTFVDSNFKRNREAANAAGLIVGAYHFFRNTSTPEGQVDNFVRTVGPISAGDLPPVLDLEVPNQWNFPTEERMQRILEWIDALRNRLGNHIHPIIYLSPSFADDILNNDNRLKDHPLWLAHYTSADAPRVPRPWDEWTFWQWTNKGRMNGIKGDVDLNRFHGGRERFEKLLVE